MDAGLTPSNLCLDVATKKCDFEVRCKTEDNDDQGRNNDQIAASEKARCIASEASDQGCILGTAGWKLGRATLNEPAYRACIDTMYPAGDGGVGSCDRDLNVGLTSCSASKYITPLTVVGGLCTHDGECISGYCTVAAAAACGQCMAYKAIGTSCDRDAMCNKATSFCPGGDGNGSTCRAYIANGQPCTRLEAQQEECGPGNVCQAAGPFVFGGTCAVGKLEGNSCVVGGMQCLRSGHGITELVCAPVAGIPECVKVVNTVAGRQCANGDFANLYGWPYCMESEFCSSGLCFPRKALGATCANTDQCVFGTRCLNAGAGLACTAFRDLNETCGTGATAANNCKNLLRCPGGTCVPELASLTETCGGGVTCAEGFCDSTNHCSALGGVDAGCTANAQCQSYSCSTTGPTRGCVKGCWQ
ncbi:MAG: hypothetical protein ACYC8T_18130 [Myxococcaceae bacterium]